MWKGLCLLLLLACAGVPSQVAAAPGDSVGHLLFASGTVQVRRGAESPLKLSTLSPLKEGDRLFVAPASTARLVLYQTGQRYTLNAKTTVIVRRAALAPVDKSRPAVEKSTAVPLPSVVGPGRIGAVLGRSAGDELRDLTPYGAAPDVDIVFRWTAEYPSLAKGTTQLFQLFQLQDGGTDKRILEADLPLSVREFKVPSNRITEGNSYRWVIQVDARELTTMATATFRTLSTIEKYRYRSLSRAAKEEAEAAPTDPTPHLWLALACQRMGLLAEARAALDKAAALAPGDEGIKAASETLNAAINAALGIKDQK